MPLSFTSTLVEYCGQGLIEPTRMDLLIRLHSNGRFLALPSNVRLVWKWVQVANTLTYYDAATITAVRSVIVQVSVGNAEEKAF